MTAPPAAGQDALRELVALIAVAAPKGEALRPDKDVRVDIPHKLCRALRAAITDAPGQEALIGRLRFTLRNDICKQSPLLAELLRDTIAFISRPPPAAVGDSGAVAVSSETQTPSPEPVAWLLGDLPTSVTLNRQYAEEIMRDGRRPVTPLYTHPSPDIRDAERIRAVIFATLRAHNCSPSYARELADAIDTAIAKERDK